MDESPSKIQFPAGIPEGQDNAVADALSQITTHLRLEVVQAILDGAAIGAFQRAEGEDPAVIEGDQQKEKEVCVTAGWVLVEMQLKRRCGTSSGSAMVGV